MEYTVKDGVAEELPADPGQDRAPEVEPDAGGGGSTVVGGGSPSNPSEVKLTAKNRGRVMFGRRKLVTDYDAVDGASVADALFEVLPAHHANAFEINYLWRYYKGRQPVLDRVKDVRPDINNKVVENHAQEIVAFKVGYQLAEPLQYTCRKSDDDGYQRRLGQVNELNTLMFAEDKAACDRDLFEWMCVGGTGYRFIEADRRCDAEEGSAPWELFSLDPRRAGVAYSSSYHSHPVFAFIEGRAPKTHEPVYTVFTDKEMFVVTGGKASEPNPHTYGHVPIVEYRLNNARMGVFEPVLPLLDAINTIESNRLDGIEQTVQSLMKFINVDITADDFIEMLKLGGIKLESTRDGAKSDVEVLKNDLDQTQTQVTKDDIYQAVLNICGMPSRASGSTTADTGAAVILRDGWTAAESHAKSYELQFQRAERETLRVVLSICRQSKDTDIDLRIRDIELVFNRRNYENILVKSQVLTTMLKCNDIHPSLAFQSCGMFTDPEAAYAMSSEWAEKRADEAREAFGDGGGEPAAGHQAAQPEPSDNALAGESA